jgi:hypothetical protein
MISHILLTLFVFYIWYLIKGTIASLRLMIVLWIVSKELEVNLKHSNESIIKAFIRGAFAIPAFGFLYSAAPFFRIREAQDKIVSEVVDHVLDENIDPQKRMLFEIRVRTSF